LDHSFGKKTGGEIIGQMLAKAGATHAFGIPGGEVLALMDGLDAAGIRFTLVKHENAGGFFAEGLWHASGALPVLVATLGPGVANAVNVVANAMQDRVPLIFLTGCVDAVEAETYTHQVFDHQAMLRPIVKASFRLATGAVGATMAKAIAIAVSGQQGPVHIDVPISVAEKLSEEAGSWGVSVPAAGIPAQAELDQVLGILARAKQPIAIAGVDAVNENAGPEVAAFCREHAIPLLTTYKGKGLLDEGDALSLGGCGLSPKADKVLLPLIAQADVVLLLGYDPIEMRVGWRNPWGANQTVIEIAPVLRTHGMHRVDVPLIAGLKQTLPRMKHRFQPRWTVNEISDAREALQSAFAGPDNWGPHAVFRTLRRVLPDETIATADSGAHRILVSQMWHSTLPRQMLQSTALCTMACALPLAAGAKIGRPEVPVIAFMGDAGLEMGAGELATLRDLKLPVIICVLVDESLALIELKQRGSQRKNLGVDFGGTDFPALAKAFGGHGVWVDNEQDLAREAKAAMTRDHFTLIAARISKRAYDGAF
jgi:acetolactate synthase I/II/III large subunit